MPWKRQEEQEEQEEQNTERQGVQYVHKMHNTVQDVQTEIGPMHIDHNIVVPKGFQFSRFLHYNNDRIGYENSHTDPAPR